MKQIYCAVTYLVSTLLWTLVNPRGLWQTIAQSGGQIIAVARRLVKKEDAGMETAVSFALPFSGQWTVVNGGVERQNSHSWSLAAQRYAYDFVITGDDGNNHIGEGRVPQDYHCFGQPIFAAADGEVVDVRGDVADYGRCQSCWIDWRTRDIRGNSVTIKHAEGVYSLSAHLQQGSIEVQPGDRVQRGQLIGRCGNSGHATEPHLHFQVQDHPNFFLAVGLPVRFSGFSLQAIKNGEIVGPETAVAAGYLSKNHVVQPLESATGEVIPLAQSKWGWGDFLTSVGVFVLGLFGIGYIILDIFGGALRLLF